MFYPLVSPTLKKEEKAAFQRVIDSGQFTMDREVRRFEDAFAAYHGCRHAVMVNSGSSANLIAIAALCHKQGAPLRPGDEVIVPAISWATTYTPLQQYGLRLRFVDVELDSVNMDVAQLEAALGPKTRAIVGVSILGNPAALDVMAEFAAAHDLYFFEDNCESLGARLPGGKLTGTFGHLSTFSFFFSHHICTMEGGMVMTDDTELYHLALSLRSHGWTRDLPDDTPLIGAREEDFNEAYRFILPGYNVRPMELSGAAGTEQLKKLEAYIDARRANLATFETLFGGDERFIIQKQNGKSSSFCFPIILAAADKDDRRRAFAALKNAEIGFRMVTGGCFPRHEVIRYFDYDCVDDLPNANRIHDFGFFVGNHPVDLTPQLEKTYDVLSQVLK